MLERRLPQWKKIDVRKIRERDIVLSQNKLCVYLVLERYFTWIHSHPMIRVMHENGDELNYSLESMRATQDFRYVIRV